MDNLQGLLGKPKISVLDATATPEQKAEWRAKVMREHLGAPADIKEYEPVYGADAVDFKDYKRPESYDKGIKELLGKHHAPKELGVELLSAFDKIIVGNSKKQAELQTQLAKEDEAFKATITKTFGPDADKRVADSMVSLAKTLPDTAVPMLASLDPTGRAMVAMLADHFSRKYTGEGLLGAAGASGAGAGTSIDAMRTELHALVAKPELQNMNHPEYQTLRAKQSELERRIWDAKKNMK